MLPPCLPHASFFGLSSRQLDPSLHSSIQFLLFLRNAYKFYRWLQKVEHRRLLVRPRTPFNLFHVSRRSRPDPHDRWRLHR